MHLRRRDALLSRQQAQGRRRGIAGRLPCERCVVIACERGRCDGGLPPACHAGHHLRKAKHASYASEPSVPECHAHPVTCICEPRCHCSRRKCMLMQASHGAGKSCHKCMLLQAMAWHWQCRAGATAGVLRRARGARLAAQLDAAEAPRQAVQQQQPAAQALPHACCQLDRLQRLCTPAFSQSPYRATHLTC